eukprot:scpid46314/ scgid18051/ WD repeat-containing protein 75
MEEEQQFIASVRGGQSITARPPVFSANAEFVYCCSGNTVRVYSAKSGRFVRSLRDGHTGYVTGITLNPRNCFQVITCGEDGNVVVWDTDGGILKVSGFGEPLTDIALLSSEQQDRVFCLQEKSNNDYSLFWFDLASMTMSAASPSSEKITDGPKAKHLFDLPEPRQQRIVVNKATSSVVVCSRKNIYMWSCVRHQLTKLSSSFGITCVASHPSQACIATGCAGGQIKLWYKIADGASQVESVDFHWHSHAVMDLAFTHDGSYLLSGGEESVLVAWRLEDAGSTKKFLPRLGAPLKHITSSPSDDLRAISHADNVIRMVSGNTCSPMYAIGGLLKVFTGDRYGNRLPAGLVVHHSQSGLVLNGASGMLQIYDPFADKPFFDVDVVCANYVAPSLEKIVPFPVVNHVAMSDDGMWLATVEHWQRPGFAPSQQLKFWHFSRKAGQFKPISHVDESLAGRITSLHFQPSAAQLSSGISPEPMEVDDLERSKEVVKPAEVLCVTSYDTGVHKCWASVGVSTKQGERVIWKCWSSTHHRPAPVVATAFTTDGTLLAVAYEKLITLWDVESGDLRSTLVLPHADDAIRLLVFGSLSSTRYLLAATSRYLICWDVVTGSIVSTVQVSLAVLTADRHSPYVAAITKSTPAYPHVSAFIFKPGDTRTVCNVSSFSSQPVVGAAFVPRPSATDKNAEEEQTGRTLEPWRRKSELFVITQDQKLLYLRRSDEAEVSLEEGEEEQNQPTALAKFIEEKSVDVKQALPSLESGQRQHTAHLVLSAPAHTLPTMSSLCTTFLESLLLPKAEVAQ